MDTTECLGLPYPECSPPIVKDASDIEQFEDLATAVNSAVQALAETVDETLLFPDAVRMTGGQGPVAGRDLVQPLGGTVLFDTANMGDTVADVIRIQEDGWYIVGGYVRADSTNTTSINLRVETLVNGVAVSARQGPGWDSPFSETVNWNDVLFLRAGDAIQPMTHHADTTVLTVLYTVQMWAFQVRDRV